MPSAQLVTAEAVDAAPNGDGCGSSSSVGGHERGLIERRRRRRVRCADGAQADAAALQAEAEAARGRLAARAEAEAGRVTRWRRLRRDGGGGRECG